MARLSGMYLRRNCWWFRYTPAPGQPQVRVSLKTRIEQLAAVKAMQILQRAPLDKAREFDVELETYLEESLRLRRMAKGTVISRRKVLTVFADLFHIRRVADITTSVVERWVAFLQEGGKGKGEKRKAVLPGTVVSYVFHLRAFCRWLLKKNKIRENPAAAVELGKVEMVVRKNFLSADAVRRLIDTAPDDDMRFVYYCGFHAGMRKMEIIEARPDWFRLGDGQRRGLITVHATPTFSVKDRDERSIPLGAEFEGFLRTYLANVPAGSEFVLKPDCRHGQSRYRYDFRRPFDLHTRSQGVKCTPHDMRRTFVSLKVLENSTLIFKLAKWTGTNVKTLQSHYAHLLADDEDIEVGLGKPKPVQKAETLAA